MVRGGQSGIFTNRVAVRVVTLVAALFLSWTCAISAQAQTFQVIHAFTNNQDGYSPEAGVTLDAAGNIYGSTTNGTGPGSLFRLRPAGGGWVLNNLYQFHGSDGFFPQARMTVGPDGSLYGTTPYGGAFNNGTVYNLRPPATVCRTTECPWTERVLYSFQGGDDGLGPFLVEPVFDQLGNLYGTTSEGGSQSPAGGVIFKLSQSGGVWTESVLYSFAGTAHPYAGVVFDSAGNLYGTTTNAGPYAVGYIFQLALPGGVLTDLHNLHGVDGGVPLAELTVDASGKVYGTASGGGPIGGGVAFELTPGSPWNYSLMAALSGGTFSNLAMDSAGNFFGTTYQGGAHGYGSVFQLTPTGGGWMYTTLHDFTDGADGGIPTAGPTLDRNGNLYGTTSSGGQLGGNCPQFGCGVVWEITR